MAITSLNAPPRFRRRKWQLGSWYKPIAAPTKEYKEASAISKLLPFLGTTEDIQTVARQLYAKAGGKYGAEQYLKPPPYGARAAAPTTDFGSAVETALGAIKDVKARSWAKSVWDIYREFTPTEGMRTREQQMMLRAMMEELMADVPDEAQPYAAIMQRLVMPTVRRPAREWYELPEHLRSTATQWGALGYTRNPQWM
ncbi:MAG: hypothetical protein ACFFDE_08110 [Promethearchaeota archaeon]